MALPHSHLRLTVNQDGAVILDTDGGRITTLNATGALVWQGLERGESVEAIAADLARSMHAPNEVVKQDIAAFIEALSKQNLLPDKYVRV